MSVTLKIANVWRVLRDVNLEAIRIAAESRFVIPLIADDLMDARGVAGLLSRGGHPWLPEYGAASGPGTQPQRPLLAVLIARQRDLPPDLTRIRSTLAADRIPVITVIVGDDRPPVAPAPDEAARLVAPSIDSRLGRDLAAALLRATAADRHLALARQLPAVRQPVIAALVETTAQANAGFAFASGLAEIVPVLTAPVNVGDMVVLTKNQLVMSYRIALAAGLEGNARSLIPEIVGVLGAGLLFRQLARQLVGLIPVVGLVPQVAVAYGGTFTIGHAVAGWALEGRAVSQDVVQRFSREGLDRGRELARDLARGARAARVRPRAPRRDALPPAAGAGPDAE